MQIWNVEIYNFSMCLMILKFLPANLINPGIVISGCIPQSLSRQEQKSSVLL
jgi:hypothetical protein